MTTNNRRSQSNKSRRTSSASARNGSRTSASSGGKNRGKRRKSGSGNKTRLNEDYIQMTPEEREAEQQERRRQKKKAALLREKKQVRHHILFTGILMTAVFAGMVVYLLVFSNAKAEELFENDYNRRQEILLSQNIRGKIYSADGVVLAETVEDEEGNSERVYPYANLFAHVVGYTYQGGSGIEQLEDYELSQTDISLSEKAYYDEINEKYPANDVYTTLNYELQAAAYEALGDYDGAIIVTEVDTGNILAMVSKPDFDPNTIEEDWEELNNDSESATFVNRATQGLYAPGSTFKIFDVIELLTEDIGNATSFYFECIGYTTIEDTMINCYHWTAHGGQDLAAAFADSCNSAFVTIGYSLDRDLFNETLSTLMFNESLPYDLPSGTSTYTLTDETETEDVLQLAIGQGETLMTPMHLNMITSAIANGGTVYKNQVIASIQTGTGTMLEETEAEAYRTVMSEEIAEYLRDYMREVVTDGTASKLSGRSYNAAGKTGSAEYLDGETSSHAWFTGFAPYEDPEIAITVILEGAGSGGTAAVPVARDVLDAYFGVDADEEEDDTSTSTSSASTSTSSSGEETDSSAAAEEEDDPSEGTPVTLNVDSNGDGIMDAIDTNGDGIPEAFDTDGDGIPETTYEQAMAAATAALEAIEAETAGAADDTAETNETAGTDTSAESYADTEVSADAATDTYDGTTEAGDAAADTTADTTAADAAAAAGEAAVTY